MANRTVKDAQSIHGTNPQYLVEKITRTRIYDSKYWKEQCFALTAELLVDKAMELRYIGGVFGGNIKPSPFLCLVLKMLQIQPEKDIVIEFIKQDDFKYVRALGAFYMRLVYSSLDAYKYLEPLLNDYRKLRMMNRNGQFELSHMDQFIDGLLREERINDIMLPRIQKRFVHEANNELEGRISLLDDDLLDDLDTDSEDEDELPPSPPPTPPTTATASLRRAHKEDGSLRDDRGDRRRTPTRNGRSDREREKRHRSRDRGRGVDEDRKRRRSPRERRHKSPGHRHHHKHRSSRSEREHKDKHRDQDHQKRTERRRDHHRSEHRSDRADRKRHRRDRNDDDAEVAEANALRAKLGMAPLRR